MVDRRSHKRPRSRNLFQLLCITLVLRRIPAGPFSSELRSVSGSTPTGPSPSLRSGSGAPAANTAIPNPPPTPSLFGHRRTFKRRTLSSHTAFHGHGQAGQYRFNDRPKTRAANRPARKPPLMVSSPRFPLLCLYCETGSSCPNLVGSGYGRLVSPWKAAGRSLLVAFLPPNF